MADFQHRRLQPLAICQKRVFRVPLRVAREEERRAAAVHAHDQRHVVCVREALPIGEERHLRAAEIKAVADARHSQRNSLSFGILHQRAEHLRIPLRHGRIHRADRAGIQRAGQTANVIFMRMRRNDGIKVLNPQRLGQVGVDELAGGGFSAVNHHGVAVADENCAVRLTDIEEIHR